MPKLPSRTRHPSRGSNGPANRPLWIFDWAPAWRAHAFDDVQWGVSPNTMSADPMTAETPACVRAYEDPSSANARKRARGEAGAYLRAARHIAARGMTARPQRNPFDQFDNRPTQLSVGECRIGLQQAERMRVRDERQRRHAVLLGGLFAMVVSLEEGIHGYLETPCDLRERPAPTRFAPFSYFCTC